MLKYTKLTKCSYNLLKTVRFKEQKVFVHLSLCCKPDHVGDMG